MTDFFIRFRDYLVFAICLLVSVLLLNTNRNPQMEIIRLEATTAAGYISQPFSFIPGMIRLYRENHELNRTLFRLNQENVRLKELEEENERLRDLLNFSHNLPFEFIPAVVIGRSAGEAVNTTSLNKGRIHGLREEMPVVSSHGLVGKIIAVNQSKSLCQIMLDSRFGAAVKLQRSRIDGIIQWQGGDLCRLVGIPLTLEVTPGDTLVTSGLGGVYPKGLYVGEVVKVEKKPGILFQEIHVKPFTDFHRLEEVFVLKR